MCEYVQDMCLYRHSIWDISRKDPPPLKEKPLRLFLQSHNSTTTFLVLIVSTMFKSIKNLHYLSPPAYLNSAINKTPSPKSLLTLLALSVTASNIRP